MYRTTWKWKVNVLGPPQTREVLPRTDMLKVNLNLRMMRFSVEAVPLGSKEYKGYELEIWITLLSSG